MNDRKYTSMEPPRDATVSGTRMGEMRRINEMKDVFVKGRRELTDVIHEVGGKVKTSFCNSLLADRAYIAEVPQESIEQLENFKDVSRVYTDKVPLSTIRSYSSDLMKYAARQWNREQEHQVLDKPSKVDWAELSQAIREE